MSKHAQAITVAQKICHSCEEPLEKYEDYGDVDNNDICESCWSECVFECCKCGSYEYTDFQHEIGDLLVVFDDEFGIPPATYEIVRHPYYWDAMLYGGLYGDSLVRIGPLIPGADSDYPMGHVCRWCKEAYLRWSAS